MPPADGGTPDLRDASPAELLARVAICSVDDADSIAAEPISWAWDRVIAAVGVTELSGGPGAGKSTLATLLAVAMAAPTNKQVTLLGRAVTPMAEGKRAVVVLAENSAPSAVAHVERAIAVLGLDREQVWPRLALMTRRNQVEVTNHNTNERPKAARRGEPWAALQLAIDAGLVGYLALDTRAALFGGDANDEGAQADVASALRNIAERGHLSVTLTSHTKKEFTAFDVAAVSGSQQRAGGADTVLLMRAERERGRVISTTVTSAKSRDLVDDDAGFEVTYAFAKDAILGTWSLATDTAGEATKSPAERVIAFLATEAKPVSERGIRDAARVSGTAIKGLLRNLQDSGHIRRTRDDKWVLTESLFVREVGR